MDDFVISSTEYHLVRRRALTCLSGLLISIIFLHRIVARTFLGLPPSEKHIYVNHKNLNGRDNCVENLEYVTASQNISHSYIQNPIRKSASMAKPVQALDMRYGSELTFPSVVEAARCLGINQGSLSRYCHGLKQHPHIKFRFAHDSDNASFDGEIWRNALHPKTGVPIAGRQISSCGRIQSKYNRISCGYVRPDGYCTTKFTGQFFSVHRLVARSFLGEPPTPEHIQVNYVDGNPSNNRVENLQYVTASQNVLHSYRTNAKRRTASERLSKAVMARKLGEQQWNYHRSRSEAAHSRGVSRMSVYLCCSGKAKHTRGFEFKCATSTIQLPGEEWREAILPARLRLQHLLETDGIVERT